MWTGPGPECAIGGDTVTDRLGSEARGRRRGTGGSVRVKFTWTGLEAIRLKPCKERRVRLTQGSISGDWRGSVRDPAYCYKVGLCEVPEGLPELQVQILRYAFELSSPQLRIDDVFS